MLGTILRWNRARGFGFAVADDNLDVDVFTHCSVLPKGIVRLIEGQRIEFELGKREGNKGPCALNVRLINPPQQSGSLTETVAHGNL
jgi:cold shock CspA family protein